LSHWSHLTYISPTPSRPCNAGLVARLPAARALASPLRDLCSRLVFLFFFSSIPYVAVRLLVRRASPESRCWCSCTPLAYRHHSHRCIVIVKVIGRVGQGKSRARARPAARDARRAARARHAQRQAPAPLPPAGRVAPPALSRMSPRGEEGGRSAQRGELTCTVLPLSLAQVMHRRYG